MILQLYGFKRKLLQGVLYELIGTLIAFFITLYIFDDYPAHYLGLLTITLSVLIVIWTMVFNTIFEYCEKKLGYKKRSLLTRLIHTITFETGLLMFTLPLLTYSLNISLLQAFLIDLGFIGVFAVYTFIYQWVFDKAFGLPFPDVDKSL